MPLSAELKADRTWLAHGLGGLLVFAGLYLASLYSYLLFHSLAEMFSVVVACAVFVVAWNSRRIQPNPYLLFLGIAYLAVAALDFLHMLAYKGMGVFPGRGSDLPTQLWIAARYVQALSLLAAPAMLGRRLGGRAALAIFGAVLALLLTAIFPLRLFPQCFVEGAGLTPFKKASEYIICLVLAGALTFTWRAPAGGVRPPRPAAGPVVHRADRRRGAALHPLCERLRPAQPAGALPEDRLLLSVLQGGGGDRPAEALPTPVPRSAADQPADDQGD